MKNIFIISLLMFAFAYTAYSQTQPEMEIEIPPLGDLEMIPDQFIVMIKESVAKPVILQDMGTVQDRNRKETSGQLAREANEAVINAVAERSGVKRDNILHVYADVVVGFAAKLTPDQVIRLQSDPDVEEVYQDFEFGLTQTEVEYDPIIEETAFAAQTTPCSITKAGGSVNGANKSTWIWIADTGIDLDHPDLNVETSGTFAKSFVWNESVNDGHGHGTHVAGIAAAKNNTIGVVGMSAGAKVVPVKVMKNNGKGSNSDIKAGLNHVAKHYIKGDVVNMSLGQKGKNNCENTSLGIRNAIRNLADAGVHVVIASGNESSCANDYFPGCIDRTRVYTVGSISCNNVCAASSNFSIGPVDWVAVGVSVLSTWKGGGYTTSSGTSMAAPIVAGIIHSKNGAPVSAGNISCGNGCAAAKNYKIAKR